MPLEYVRPPDIYNGDDRGRFALGTRGRRSLVVFGVNPSTACEDVPDQTINRVESFAARLGFDSWLMLNLYPQRTTNPRGLHKQRDDALHLQNLEAIEDALRDTAAFTLCAAWGLTITRRSYLQDCLREIDVRCQAYRRRWHMLGQATQDGHPRHPSRLSLDETLRPFAVRRYLT